MTTPADIDGLPAPEPTFALQHDERLSGGLRRLSVGQFDDAVDSLTGGDLATAVHTTRKSIKRVRAVLRLVRSELGDKTYTIEDRRLRDTGRILAPLRDAHVAALSVSDLRSRYGSYLHERTFAELERELMARANRIAQSATHEGNAVRTAVYALRSSRARYAAWPVDEEGSTGAVAHRFESFGVGLGRTYRNGRDAMATATDKPTGDNFHGWRKQVKYLRHQSEILTPLWPEVLTGQATTLGRIGDLLGEEHDLVELMRLVTRTPHLMDDPLERSLLMALGRRRREELQAAALTLGRRVYGEPPKQFVRRIESYWSAWQDPIPIDSLP